MFNNQMYEIVEFNYLKLDLKNKVSGQMKTICPFCSENRTNKRDKSLSVNIATGVYNCHYCSKTGNIHKWRKIGARKNYVKPVWNNKTELSDKLVKWFEGRGISQGTLNKMRVTEEKEWMPQTEKEENCVVFNYFYEDVLINKKFRDGRKNFKLVKDAEKILYNLDSVFEKGNKKMIICEGECFDKNTEILTNNYWKKFSDLTSDDLVASVDNDRNIKFIKPNKYIKKHYKGNLLKYTNKINNFYSLTTPEHNLVCLDDKKELIKIKAKDVNTKQIKIPRTCTYNGEGLNISDDLLKLYIAISADFTIRKQGDIYGRFKKKRKKDRIIEILNNLNLRYSCTIDKRNYYSVFIHRKQGLNPFKIFPKDWVTKLSQYQIDLILKEIILWDGNSVNNRTMKEYNSKDIENIKFIQTLCHLAGKTSTIHKKRKNKYGEWYKLTLLEKKYSIITSYYKTEVSYNDYVYCVTVDSGMILVKQEDKIMISGNCDALSYIESGINFALSVPNGANTNTDYLDNYMPLFDDIEEVYLATDNDTKGLQLREELLRRFGAGRCRKVDFEDCKDANEYLIKYGKIPLLNTISKAQKFPIEGIIRISDIEDELNDMYENGIGEGFRIGDKYIDEQFRLELGRVMVITAIPAHGKTTMINYLTSLINFNIGWKIGYFSPESQPIKLHVAKLEQLFIGKNFTGQYKMTLEEHQMAMQYMNDNFYFIQPEKRTLDNILDIAGQAVKNLGLKVVVIDPWNRLEGMSNKNDDIGDELNKVSNFALDNNIFLIIVAHPKKMPKDKNTLMYEEPEPYDIKGSSCWYDKPDYILTFYRDYKNVHSRLRLYKLRENYLGQMGTITKFKYNVNNERFSCIEDANGMPVNLQWDNTNWLTGEGKIERDISDIEYLNSIKFNPPENKEKYNYDNPPF